MKDNVYRLQRGSVEKIDRHKVHQSIVRKQMVDYAKANVEKKNRKEGTSAEAYATGSVESSASNTAYYAGAHIKERLKRGFKNRRENRNIQLRNYNTMGSDKVDPSFLRNKKKKAMKRYVVDKQIQEMVKTNSNVQSFRFLKQFTKKAIETLKRAVINPVISLGGTGLISLVLVLSFFLGTFSVFAYEETVIPSVMSVSDEVLAYQSTIERYCEQYDIEEYVSVVMAIMMQESGGRGTDPMQCSESGFNTRYPSVPNSITDPEYSIQIGVKTFADCLTKAGVSSPGDTEKLKLAIQAYNYGSGYITWAKTNFGGYTQANAQAYSEMMREELETSGYGDVNYVDHVLRYVSFGFGSLRSQPDFNNSAAWGSNNVYTSRWLGQCTWFAWARFYEIYGYSPGFTGAGYQCVDQLLAAHGDKFSCSTEPAAGAVFSYNAANNHTGIVVAVNGDSVTVQEGNIGSDYHLGGSFPGVAWNYPFSQANASTPFGWWETTYTRSAMASRGATYAVPNNSVALEQTSVTVSSNSKVPTIDYLAELAEKKYGMSRKNVVDALKLCTNEGYTASEILPYYMACTTINHYLAHPEMNLLRNWGGGDADHYFEKLDPKPESYIQDFAKKAFYQALVKLDKRAWDIHGMVPENRAQAGGFDGTQHLDEAFYVEKTWVWGAYGKFKGYIAVWDRDAKWYR